MLRRFMPAVPVAVLLCGAALALPIANATQVQTTAVASTPAKPQILSTATLSDLPIKDVQNAVLPGSVANDRGLLLGGIGSDLYRRPSDPANEYWMVTDRGPNGQIKVDGANRRTFPIPEFDPMILHVRAEGSELKLLATLPILTPAGEPVTGLSNLPVKDETPYDYSAQVEQPFNQNGLDTEGLVRTTKGDFWLVEEYRPSLVHVGADGKVIRRYIPQGIALPEASYPVSATLPAIFDVRKSNRGFEGLAISPDDTTLFIALQSPLSNPNKNAGEASRNTRILAFDIATETVIAEYVYRFEEATVFDPDSASKSKPTDEMKISGVLALDAKTLVVLERTDLVARLYRVDLSKATNILGTKWDAAATTPSLEQTSDLVAAGVTELPKTLESDLEAAGAPDKIEGVVLLNYGRYAIANDNDFDIGTFDQNGNNIGAGIKSKLMIVETNPAIALPLVGGTPK